MLSTSYLEILESLETWRTIFRSPISVLCAAQALIVHTLAAEEAGFTATLTRLVRSIDRFQRRCDPRDMEWRSLKMAEMSTDGAIDFPSTQAPIQNPVRQAPALYSWLDSLWMQDSPIGLVLQASGCWLKSVAGIPVRPSVESGRAGGVAWQAVLC